MCRRACLTLGAIAFAALLVGCPREQPEATAVGAAPVLVEPAQLADLEVRIEATGELVAKASASLAAEVPGQVTRVAVDEGSAVERGEVVLKIDPERRELERDSLAAQLEQARAELHEAERENGRIEQLSARRAVSQAQRDEAATRRELARSRVVAAEAQLGLARRALADSRVLAPFAGLVARRFVSEGEFVAPGQKLFQIVALDPIELEFHLAEVDSGRVEIGDPVAVRVSPYPDEVFRAAVSAISPTIDSTTRTLRVKALMANPGGRLRPGLFARVDLGVSRREGVVMVPEEAILQRSDGAVIFRLVDEDHVERLRVVTGVHRAGRIEVTSGVAAGDLIVLRGQASLIDGAVVALRNADGSSVQGPLDAGARVAADGSDAAREPIE